jgi:bifunctional enzyme CysN/CysC
MTMSTTDTAQHTETQPRPAPAERGNGGIPAMDLLRFSTAGSVDDGKSTLIGRLLYDTKSIFQDQLEAVERTSKQRGEGYVNLALLTDGLRAEREQNITIDVAYRYFATPKRKFIIADTPGHVQYTRNMVTGASTAELAIVLVDARKGVLTQSKRHGFLSSLLGIPHVVVAVNKMDLVGYSEDVYRQIVREYTEFAEKLSVKDLTFIPISALHGDNVVNASDNTPWYDGATLLHHLETVNLGANRNLVDFRYPVQYVVRPHQDYRGYAGRIASGTIRPGEEVLILPSRQTTRIKSVETYDGPVDEASASDSVILTTEDERDISRGDMIVRKNNVPTAADRVEAIVCWMNDEPLDPDRDYLLQHTTQTVRARIEKVAYRIDVDTLHREEVPTLGLNDIGRLTIATGSPIFFDPYQINAATGSFILIDPATNVTVAGGMIRGATRDEAEEAQEEPAGHGRPPRTWSGRGSTSPARSGRSGTATRPPCSGSPGCRGPARPPSPGRWSAPSRPGVPDHAPGRRPRPPRPLRRPRLQPGGPEGEHPPGGRGRTPLLRTGLHRALHLRLAVPRGPAAGAGALPGGTLPRDLRGLRP